ncbi:hypothetical protein BDV33DRAFT_183463 [Aspergillus novoparasiticus]|uniref:Uncharacterized protein n=1 Tax=Aspergillus novoparasiticus TaxID=986946 RepID=A0A5N6E9V5_9EURO|nr:hypothetical protein BDV33DRAFT_183463 [Aspergillus novoparasiticus]
MVPKLESANMYQRIATIFIGTSVLLFAALELEQYTSLYDRYPMACNIVNALICVITCIKYSIHR